VKSGTDGQTLKILKGIKERVLAYSKPSGKPTDGGKV
jgi:hypothetical protein